MQKNITKGSLSESMIIILAQVGIIGRRELSKVMYRQSGGDGGTERYGAVTTPVLSKVIRHLKEKGYVEVVKLNGQRKEDYFILSDKGWQYVDQHDLPYDEEMRRYSVGDLKNLKNLMRHSNAIYLGRSMRVFSLGSEKPTYAEFAMAMDSQTTFYNVRNFGPEFGKEILQDFLPSGICYSTAELRRAYAASNSTEIYKNTSRRMGMIFYMDRMITMYEIDSKFSVMSKHAESKFDKTAFKDIYEGSPINFGPKVDQVAYIMAPSLMYMPSFFHGCADGVNIRHRDAKPQSEEKKEKKSVFAIAQMGQYDRIYMLPMTPEFSNYREALDNYTMADYRKDLSEFLDKHPDVQSSGQLVVIARYPDLMYLYRRYINKEKVILVGPNNELFIDALSRCLRHCLIDYYDINTGKKLPHTRYSKYGEPFIGNTNQINHSALKMDMTFKSDQHDI